jgi:hypothetical protein
MMRQWHESSSRVLDYETPPPPMTWWEQVIWWIATHVDPLGGFRWAMFEISLILLAIALLLPIIGMPCYVLAAAIWWWLIDRWAKTSRWF